MAKSDSLIKRWLGLDLIDTLVHIAVTGCFMGFVEMTHGPDAIYPVATGVSILVFAIRRKYALRKAAREEFRDTDRMADVEERLGYLEGLQDRVLELEERLDFAERMLAKRPESVGQLPEGR